ncbi:permease for cytosine/purines, uracil, thiamine, allantoin-domain-containing protein [Boeremia exigua]|uniref:permease for cytosine/purines, uracil, thiamine, allantoin-domain-containing protein n=1 Tax=Boeremia exigua TaxID=749465 RepID=UPI001E8E1403|nr:permease for cytosine/purines, uracil, thiamine, allantoin-domain-containing protein [Boeremia exigua]KAH6639566.1 permease for cytosine/purines, uracil, thiamine, allantoin-domain-containing protein [Boeremia exigua]
MTDSDTSNVNATQRSDKHAVLAPEAGGGLPTSERASDQGGLRRAWVAFETQLVAYNLEARGIQRVEPDERQELRALGYSQVAIMWFSVNLAANNITLGMLGPAVFALGFVDSCLLSVFGALVGSVVVAYIATFGPRSGTRTMVFSRYSMGWWPSKIVVLLNIVVLLGYGMIDCVVAGQILSAVSGNTMSVVVGIIIVAVIAWAITTFGYQIFHYYERWAWLPQLVVLCILAGVAGPNFNVSAASHGDENPDTIIGNRISFFGLTLAAAITYGGGAADYFVYYPEHASSFKIFGMTLFGLICSFTFAFVLGIGLACGMLANPDWEAAYGTSQGALIVEAYRPLGVFGSFCGVVVALGLVANLIVPTYSSGIDAQILGRWAGAVPRVIWNTVGVIIYTVCALAGRAHLAEIFTNFLALMGYWVSIWIAIVLEEHLIFRRKTGWNWDVWNQQKKLPLGIAAFVAFVVGWVGAILCMAQVWYYGPIALLVGTYGADMGNYVGFAWAALVYPPLRMLEIKKFDADEALISLADDDLISLASDSAASLASPTTASATSKMEVNRLKPLQRDSFSDLTCLMKAKKPYTPVLPSSPSPSMSRPVIDMQFASRVSSGSSIQSPNTRAHYADRSVAAFLQSQYPPTTASEASVPQEYSQQRMEQFESIMQRVADLCKDEDDDDNDDDDDATVCNTVNPFQPDPKLSVRPIAPPTPALSTSPALPEEPMVRVTKHVWDAMGRDLKACEEKNEALELKIARLEKRKVTSPGEDYQNDLETRIGKLQYQNETNKTQMATMARTMAEKDMQIKQMQLEMFSTNRRLEDATTAAKNHVEVAAKLEYLQMTTKNGRANDCPQDSFRQLSDKSHQSAHKDADKYKTLAQEHQKELTQCEKLLQSTKEKYAAEHIKVGELEDRVEDIQRELSQGGDLRGQLKEKTSACDRLRNELNAQTKAFEDLIAKEAETRLLRASDDGKALRGGVHLVKPASDTKLSPLVLSCLECYNKNITCDNKARCRHCYENNETCSRWRCSLKHILGQCTNLPCTFPHEADGWLVATEPRPQW